jgi:hypothetical protein
MRFFGHQHTARLLMRAASICFLFAATGASAKDEVVVNAQAAEPSFAMGTDIVLKVTIANHTQQKLTYFPCPSPYSAEVSDAKGQRVEPRPAPSAESEDAAGCSASSPVQIDRGKTVSDKLKLNDKFDLLPGSYKVKLRWHFQVSFHETAGGADSRSIAVLSNTTTVAVK